MLIKQKEYNDSISKVIKSKAKILYYLNTDPNYYLKMREATKQKYDFKQDRNGRWI